MKLTNALTVDVEDYFQVSAFENSIRRGDWDSLEHRIAQNLNKVLQLFSDQEIKATFFMLSWIAERYPSLVNDIISQGHELASHGSAASAAGWADAYVDISNSIRTGNALNLDRRQVVLEAFGRIEQIARTPSA